jgi:hypothetical protein
MEDKATLPSAVQPSYHGIIVSANDEMVLLEACLRGDISPVSRRPIKEERAQVPRRGNNFIYEEKATGIKRWSDGMTWSRLGGEGYCLLSRKIAITSQKEVVELKPSLTSKEARRSSQDRISEATDTNSNDELLQPKDDLEKSDIGLSMDDGDFDEDQFFKKTMCFKIGPQTYSLVSYYSADDELAKGKLQIPSKDPKFSTLPIRREIVEQIYRITVGDDSRGFKVHELSANGFYLRSRRDRQAGAGTPALNTNSMGDAGTPALNEYNPVGDASMPTIPWVTMACLDLMHTIPWVTMACLDLTHTILWAMLAYLHLTRTIPWAMLLCLHLTHTIPWAMLACLHLGMI